MVLGVTVIDARASVPGMRGVQETAAGAGALASTREMDRLLLADPRRSAADCEVAVEEAAIPDVIPISDGQPTVG